MQPYFAAKSGEQYLVQRINGASPEQLVAMLLEGAQKFCLQAISAINKRDVPNKARLINRVSAIIEELTVGLNHEDGGQLVGNLTRIYEWWLSELFDASQKNQPDRLVFIAQQMGEMRATWDECGHNRQTAAAPAAFTAEGLVG